MPLAKWSIRLKATLSALSAVSLGILVAGWLALRSLEELELARLDETLSVLTDLAAYDLTRVLPPNGRVPLPSPERHALQSAASEVEIFNLLFQPLVGGCEILRAPQLAFIEQPRILGILLRQLIGAVRHTARLSP